MGFTFALILTIVAGAHASAVYNAPRRLSAPVRTYGGPVPPVRDSYLDAKLAGVGAYDNSNKYDATRLVHDTVYNPRRLEVNSGLGTLGVDSFGQGVRGDRGFRGQGLQCRDCRRDEECVEGRFGRSTCVPTSRFSNRGDARLQGRLPGNRQGLGRAQQSECMYLEYPSHCLSQRNRGGFATPFYAFTNGVCRRFSSSVCTAQPENNIFSSLSQCRRHCRL